MTLPTTRAFCLPNNSALEIKNEPAPWTNTEPIPAFESKDEYREWCKHPDTDHLFFSMVEGISPGLRVGTTNEPYRVHGLVADYDVHGLTDSEITAAVSRFPSNFPPLAWNVTFSRGLRVVWRFQEPVFYYSAEVYKKFVQRIAKELDLASIAPKLDDHIEMAELYYAAGAGWTVNENAFIPQRLIELWLFDVTKNAKFDGGGPEIPLEVIAAEVEKRFPGRWQGEFADGARGVRFWDATGDAKSAIVRKTGMVAFTGDEPFVPWDKIFGKEFVQAYRASRLGKALEEMFSDGECYYRKLPDGRWDACPATNARRHLRVHYGLSEKPAKGEENSEIDMVLHQLEMRKRITGALPFPLNPNPSVIWNGQLFLNDSSARLHPMHPEPQEWGVNFPWIASYLTTLFIDERNLDAFLAWLHVWLKSAATGQPARGHSLFIAGAPGTGKTLLTRVILGRMFGGYADARDYFVDGGRFNSSLFDKALWCIDDSTVLADPNAHARFSALVKAVVANDAFQYEKKYGYSGAVPFVGRLTVTLNDDPVSLGMLPNTEQSMLDKVFMLRTDSCPADVAETEAERYVVIERELPAFMRFVHDMKIPDWLGPDPRLGVKAWHDPAMLLEARAVSPGASLMELIEERWEGITLDAEDLRNGERVYTSAQLYQTLSSSFHSVIGRMSPITFGKHVCRAINNGCPWMSTRLREGKRFYILKKLK